MRLGLVVMLHEHLVASVQGGAAGYQEHRRDGRTLPVGDDAGVISFAIPAENHYEFAVGSGSGHHHAALPLRRRSTTAWPMAARTANTACEARNPPGAREMVSGIAPTKNRGAV